MNHDDHSQHFSGVGNLAWGQGSQAGDVTINVGSAAPHPPPAPEPRPADRPQDRTVFVVHGRDLEVRSAMFDQLRALGLAPWEWEHIVDDLGRTAPFSGDVIDHGMRRAQAALVLLTPDDVAWLHPSLQQSSEPAHETAPTGQPRQNVLIELGMALMAYPDRTVIVEFGHLRPAADVTGRNVVRFDGSTAAVLKLVNRLRTAGLAVDDRGTDWIDTARFAGLAAYTRRPPAP